MSEIDDLMDLDPLELAKDPAKLDAIILYYRRQRGLVEQGIKPKKEEGPKVKVTLDMLGLAKPGPKVTRRI